MIIGGIAVIARGVPRHTDDVDATVWGPGLDLTVLLHSLEAEKLRLRIVDGLTFARQNQILLLVHDPSNVEIDLSLAWLPFEQEALRLAPRERLRGISVPVARAEDLIVYKALAWRERDRADIGHLLALHREHIDLERMLGIVSQLADAMEIPERAHDFERLLRAP
jgi:hypothetical protein